MQLYKDQPAFFEDFDTLSAFAFYESVRHRLPEAVFPSGSQNASGMLEIADQFDVFVFDAFGVLNVGNSPIDGAVETIATLRGMRKKLFIMTNAASFSKRLTVRKFENLGFNFTTDEIVTSRMAAENAILDRTNLNWGVMAKNEFLPEDIKVSSTLLAFNIADYDQAEAFLILSTWDWSNDQQILLEQSLKKKLRPIVVANPDVIAPQEDKFSTEAGFIAHRVADLLGAEIEFHGKPFASVYDIVQNQLPQNINRKRICMIGDTLHTDVLGGAAAGWSTILVSDHGLFRGNDPNEFINQSGIVPDWIIPSI